MYHNYVIQLGSIFTSGVQVMIMTDKTIYKTTHRYDGIQFWGCQEKTLNCLWFMIVLAFVEVAIVGCLIVVWYDVRRPTEQVMCVSAETMGTLEVDYAQQLRQSLTNVTKNGVIKYCGKGSDVLKWTNEYWLEKIYNDDEHPEFPFYTELIHSNCKRTDKVPSVIKLTEVDMEETKKTSGTRSRVYWKRAPESPDLSFSKSEGCVVVKSHGMYHVSSQFMLNTSMDSIEVKHVLHRKRNGMDELMMEDREAICKIDPKFDTIREMTSAMAAVFELKKQDHLYLTISHPEHLVDHSITGHYFIIYRLAM